jgi:hypothetical protein
MMVWTMRALALVFAASSAFGFLNAFYLKRHGPGGDLGIVAAGLAVAAWWASRWISDES